MIAIAVASLLGIDINSDDLLYDCFKREQIQLIDRLCDIRAMRHVRC